MTGPTSPPALVLGSGLTALGVIRCLGRAGIPILVAGRQPGFVRRSRWFRAAPGGGAAIDSLSDYLRGLDLERAVLVPCSDSTALEIAGLEPDLAARFPSSLPSSDVLEALVDKGRFADVLEANGIPHPRTIPISQPSDLEGLSDSDIQRLFIKPRDSQRFFKAFGVKAFRPKTKTELRELIGLMDDEGAEVVAQEYVSGPASNHYYVDGFVDAKGVIKACFARRRLRMWPPDFGNSSSTVSVAPEEASSAIESIKTLINALGYRGVFSAEFKKDADDGVFKIIEVNARPWWYIEFAATCGQNVCLMAYQDALGREVEATADYHIGCALVYLYYDVHASVPLWKAGELRLLDWLRSLIGVDRPFFSWDDPRPAAHMATVFFMEQIMRRIRPGARD